jgi:hypothetical protein
LVSSLVGKSGSSCVKNKLNSFEDKKIRSVNGKKGDS